MGGIDTLRGCAFQIVQALSDVVDLVLDERADAVRIEGAEDVVDYEVLDRDGRRLAVRQAKTRQASDTWGALDLARILCAWGELPDATEAQFAFVTDGRLGDSGQELDELIRSIQKTPDAEVLRAGAAKLGRNGVELPRLEVLQRVLILTQMGSTDHVLARLERRIHHLLEGSRSVTTEDAENAANKLFVKLFVAGGHVDLTQRTITRSEVLSALGIDERSLQGGLIWSEAVADRYRRAVERSSDQHHGFLPLEIVSTASKPLVLRLLEPGGDPQSTSGDDSAAPSAQSQPIDVILEDSVAVLVGASGQGKTLSLTHLASLAAGCGRIPVLLSAAGHVPGSLSRRVRNAIEITLGESLKAGALDAVMATPELLLLIDGVSEVDEEARVALRGDLQRLAGQRPLRVVATGRDLVAAVAVVDVAGAAMSYELTVLDGDSRRELAGRIPDCEADTVDLIEERLGGAVDNPMLFLMALSVSAGGVPASREAVYERFLQGLSVRAGATDPDLTFAAFGVAWADMIGENRRTVDRFTWLSALAAALTRLASVPHWRGQRSAPGDVLDRGQKIGLLARLDPDGGLAPLHDSFADYLAARAIARGEAPAPAVLSSSYDESLLFLVEINGLTDALAHRLVEENPLLLCRLSALTQVGGQADPVQVGRLLDALVRDCDLPLLGASGLRIVHHAEYTGVVLVDNGREVVDVATFDALVRDRPAVMVPPGTGSVQLAIRLWATAVRWAHRPDIRVFQPSPPNDPDAAAAQLLEYTRAVDGELVRLVSSTLPKRVRDSVLAAVGPRGITAIVGDPEPGLLDSVDIPISYRRDKNCLVLRAGDDRLEGSRLPFTDTAERLMRRHPTNQAAREIEEALTVLTSRTWPQ